MWKKLAGIAAAVMSSGCVSSGNTGLPPPPPQPDVIDPQAQAVADSFLLSPEAEMDLRKRAEAGDRDAAFRLSFHFMSAGDQERVEYWQLIAARNGHPVAQYNQWHGSKDKRDCASMHEALAWLQAAARGGSGEAQGELEAYTKAVRSCTP